MFSQVNSAITALYWVSESDEPWEILELNGEPDAERIAKLSGKSPVETKDFEQFFANATTAQDWHDEDEAADVQRYQTLVQLLQENLTDLQVYRAGKVEVDIFVTGQTKAGEWLALRTLAVET